MTLVAVYDTVLKIT